MKVGWVVWLVVYGSAAWGCETKPKPEEFLIHTHIFYPRQDDVHGDKRPKEPWRLLFVWRVNTCTHPLVDYDNMPSDRCH